MTAGELIRKLKQIHPETRIVVAGYESGFNDIATLKQINLKLNASDKWYYGQHREEDDFENAISGVALIGENKLAKDG